MKEFKYVGQLSVLLTFCAGYCDAATFFGGLGIFSAHITSNFIVFVYDILTRADAKSWLKLISLPVFVIASFTAESIFSKNKDANKLLLIEALLLLLAGGVSVVFNLWHVSTLWHIYLCTFITVFAMSLQSAYSRIFSASSYGPTTAMTGNVTQLAIDLENVIKKRGVVNRNDLKKQAILVCGFFCGAFAGGIVAKAAGLAALVIPAIIILYTYTELQMATKYSNSVQ
ncbi:YoaK family protein [Flavobacterium rivuli]|uniref:YoaK family protein n=1 Tax=Flavobacterium rivuli TaxID=498301 RepID=UPI00037FEE49|nr:YoaK family protein [Flavobacterium rivuli]